MDVIAATQPVTGRLSIARSRTSTGTAALVSYLVLPVAWHSYIQLAGDCSNTRALAAAPLHVHVDTVDVC